MDTRRTLLTAYRAGLKIRGDLELIGIKNGAEVSRSHSRNMVMQGSLTGLDLLLQWIIGGMAPAGTAADYLGGISFAELGTGSTAVALSDTALETPVARVPLTFAEDFTQTQAILQFFFSDVALADDTYTEFGTFSGGSSSLGTGKIFNHVLLSSSYVKASGQDTTAQMTFTLSQ